MTSWLHARRLQAVLDAVRAIGARTVVDLGCGEGDLLVEFVADPRIERVAGLDISASALKRLRERLKSKMTSDAEKVELFNGSILDPGMVPRGYECAVLIETIEHIDPGRLSQLERSIFGVMWPETVIITTPNSEFNGLLGVSPGRFRHPDHRFEWDRARFGHWVHRIALRHGFEAERVDIAGSHAEYGGASQMAVFRKSQPRS